MNLIAKLRIVYATACHASLHTTALACLSVNCHCHHTVLTTTNTARGGEVGISESVAATAGLCKVLCWLPLIASGNTPFLPSSARLRPLPPPGDQTKGNHPSTLMLHYQQSSTMANLSSLAYCATLGLRSLIVISC